MKTMRILTNAALGFAAAAALAYDVNKDLQHAGGPPAFDVGVLLSGPENVTAHFDGYGNRHFNSFSSGPSGGNTVLHWQNLNEPGGNGQIDPGEIVHVGWSTADHSSHVLDMYWTDKQGNRIPGSKIFNITSGWTYENSGDTFVGWSNIFRTEWGETDPIQIINVNFVIAPQPWPLAELNGANEQLNAMMQPLPGGTFVVGPLQTVELRLPTQVPPGMAVVLRYGVTGPGTGANSMDWVQFVTPQPVGCRGDMNCDGMIDFLDIDAFVAVLSGGPCCDGTGYNCDVNGDGSVGFADIDPFVALLSSGATCP